MTKNYSELCNSSRPRSVDVLSAAAKSSASTTKTSTGAKRLALPRSNRLRKRKDFENIQQKGSRVSLRDLVVACRTSPASRTRVGFTISTRVDKRSVVRNKIKRRLREIVRALKPRFLIKVDLVLIAKGSAVSSSFDELKSQVVAALQKLKVL